MTMTERTNAAHRAEFMALAASLLMPNYVGEEIVAAAGDLLLHGDWADEPMDAAGVFSLIDRIITDRERDMRHLRSGLTSAMMRYAGRS